MSADEAAFIAFLLHGHAPGTVGAALMPASPADVCATLVPFQVQHASTLLNALHAKQHAAVHLTYICSKLVCLKAAMLGFVLELEHPSGPLLYANASARANDRHMEKLKTTFTAEIDLCVLDLIRAASVEDTWIPRSEFTALHELLMAFQPDELSCHLLEHDPTTVRSLCVDSLNRCCASLDSAHLVVDFVRSGLMAPQ